MAKKDYEQLIIIGNGMASGKLIEEILERDRKRYAITVIGDEPCGLACACFWMPVSCSSVNRFDFVSISFSEMDRPKSLSLQWLSFLG